MFYVYLLRSIEHPHVTYVGYTINFKQRFSEHNRGKSIHTAKYKPWQLELCLAFRNEIKAKAFESYLKSSSGRAFANKRFW